METLEIAEKIKNNIIKKIKSATEFIGQDNQIEAFENDGNLNCELAGKILKCLADDVSIISQGYEPGDGGEFKDELEAQIEKCEDLIEEFDECRLINDKSLEDLYADIVMCIDMIDINDKCYYVVDLRNIAKSVIESIGKLESMDTSLSETKKEELQNIKQELSSAIKDEKTDIEKIELNVEVYNESAQGIWKEYLTGDEEEFCWLAHNLTKGELRGEFRDKQMSTSLITSRTMGRYGNSDYGLIINPKNIVAANYKDTYTLNWNDGDEAFYTKPPIMLPEEIEKISIEQTVDANGEMLNYDKTSIYSEIVVDDYEIEGVYYVSYGEKELAKDYESAKKIADQRNLPLREIDISKCREKQGLEPLTEGQKEKVLKNVVGKIFEGADENLAEYQTSIKNFVTENSYEFYCEFKQLKEVGSYTSIDIKSLVSRLMEEDLILNKVVEKVNTKDSIVEFDDKSRYSELTEEEEEIQEFEENMWEAKFEDWYQYGIDEPENIKDKIVKIKSDIIHSISEKTKMKNIDKTKDEGR